MRKEKLRKGNTRRIFLEIREEPKENEEFSAKIRMQEGKKCIVSSSSLGIINENE
jgi:hypothetical protein